MGVLVKLAEILPTQVGGAPPSTGRRAVFVPGAEVEHLAIGTVRHDGKHVIVGGKDSTTAIHAVQSGVIARVDGGGPMLVDARRAIAMRAPGAAAQRRRRNVLAAHIAQHKRRRRRISGHVRRLQADGGRRRMRGRGAAHLGHGHVQADGSARKRRQSDGRVLDARALAVKRQRPGRRHGHPQSARRTAATAASDGGGGEGRGGGGGGSGARWRKVGAGCGRYIGAMVDAKIGAGGTRATAAWNGLRGARGAGAGGAPDPIWARGRRQPAARTCPRCKVALDDARLLARQRAPAAAVATLVARAPPRRAAAASRRAAAAAAAAAAVAAVAPRERPHLQRMMIPSAAAAVCDSGASLHAPRASKCAYPLVTVGPVGTTAPSRDATVKLTPQQRSRAAGGENFGAQKLQR
ncbi:hypothetical protein FGB62_233g035 [Gracilaria domingensis]|nr:hypothetical protein FGB62_233g035 [Gracilaria domingensis]